MIKNLYFIFGGLLPDLAKYSEEMIMSFSASFYGWSSLWLQKRIPKINTGEGIFHFMERVLSSNNF
jgi:hypothetical protein